MLARGKAFFRAWFTRVWHLRGGGLYAVGWAVTFIYLELTTVLGELAEAEGVVDFVTNQLFEFAFRFMSDSIANMIQAFLWPVFIVQWRPPLGIIALGVAYIVFANFIKQHITAWLFPAGEPEVKSGP